MINFLSHDVPAEALTYRGKVKVIDPRRKASETIGEERIPWELIEHD
jgi:hypothetical protein